MGRQQNDREQSKFKFKTNKKQKGPVERAKGLTKNLPRFWAVMTALHISA